MPNKSKTTTKSVKTESKTQPVEKTETKAENKKKLEKVPEAVVFWCHDGQVFRDVQGLLDGFDVMTDEIFDYHVNNDKNDFSCWVQDVIGDYKLAQDLKSVKNKAQAKKKVQQRYIELTQLEG
jgi:hypothetical protein